MTFASQCSSDKDNKRHQNECPRKIVKLSVVDITILICCVHKHIISMNFEDKSPYNWILSHSASLLKATEQFQHETREIKLHRTVLDTYVRDAAAPESTEGFRC